MPTDAHDSDRMPLDSQMATHDDIMASLVRASGKTTEWRRTMDQRVAAIEATNVKMLEEIRANTEETVKARTAVEAVRDGMTTLRVFKQVVMWAGAIAAAASAIWVFGWQAISGKPMP